MRLLLIRHGQTASNVGRLLDTAAPGAQLDETGLEQARALVHRLADEDIGSIHVSDLVRTQQTAAPLALARGLPPTILPGLKEIQAGDHEMATDWTAYIEALKTWPGDPDHRIPGGDSASTFFERYDAAIDVVAESVAAHGRTAVVVSHGAAMRVWTGARCTNLPPAFASAQALPNTTVLTIEGDARSGWSLLSWGDDPVPEF